MLKQQKKSSGSKFFPVTFIGGFQLFVSFFKGLSSVTSSWGNQVGSFWMEEAGGFPTSTPQQQPTKKHTSWFQAPWPKLDIPRKYSTWHTWLTVLYTYWFKNWPFTNPYLLVSASHLFWPKKVFDRWSPWFPTFPGWDFGHHFRPPHLNPTEKRCQPRRLFEVWLDFFWRLGFFCVCVFSPMFGRLFFIHVFFLYSTLTRTHTSLQQSVWGNMQISGKSSCRFIKWYFDPQKRQTTFCDCFCCTS